VPRTAESTTFLVVNGVWVCVPCVDLGSPRNNKEIDTYVFPVLWGNPDIGISVNGK
jgi:hypothetical protein